MVWNILRLTKLDTKSTYECHLRVKVKKKYHFLNKSIYMNHMCRTNSYADNVHLGQISMIGVHTKSEHKDGHHSCKLKKIIVWSVDNLSQFYVGYVADHVVRS